MATANPEEIPEQARVRAAATEQTSSALKAEFLSRGRDALEHMERTGISYSVEELSALLTAKIEAKRAELLKMAR